jgi:oligosaccharide repeat unit polymerase
MAVAFAVFILPQAYSLVSHPYGTRSGSIDAVLLMALLCILACILGYSVPANQWIVQKTRVRIDDRRLFRWGVFFVLCGFFFMAMIAQLTDEERGGGQWTGRATIYFFFATLGYPGLAICFMQALKKKRDWGAWFWTFIGMVIPMGASTFGARREPAALFAITVAITLYYQKRYVPPRGLLIAAIAGAMIVIPATSQIRTTIKTSGISYLNEVDFVGNFQRFLSGSSILEVRNAAMIIEATNLTGNFGLGRGYWDQIVFRFVPAQFIGRENKESLMFRSPKQRDREEAAILGYHRETGTTATGVGDSYREFGYFGALFFVAMAVMFKSLWRASLQPNGIFAQLLYIQLVISAMHAVTHQTADFAPSLIYNLVFLGMAVYFSRLAPKSANANVARMHPRPI